MSRYRRFTDERLRLELAYAFGEGLDAIEHLRHLTRVDARGGI